MQEQDCDVCKMLRKIMQRLESIEDRLSRLEQKRPHKHYDPVWMDKQELETRVGNNYLWPTKYSDEGESDRFVVGDIVWGGPDELNQWVAMDQLHDDRWVTFGVLKELEENTHNQNWRMRSD